METLTADEFKKKYGGIASSQFGDSEKKNSLFDDIKQSISQRAEQNNAIISNAPGDPLGNVASGAELAANTAGGVMDVAGDVAHKIPFVGGALDAVGGALKSGFNAVTDKLAGTKFFQEAAQGLPENSNLEKGLRTASAGGQIAGDILGADIGVGGTAKALEKGASVAEKIPSPSVPSLGGATPYVAGAVRDVSPTTDSIINHQVARALDLTPGDLNNIFQSTGNDVGWWMADNNLIGVNRESTQGLIQGFFKQNYDAVRDAVSKVTTTYTPEQIPQLDEALSAIKKQIQDTPGLEEANKEVDDLLYKSKLSAEQGDPLLTLEDVQKAKELLDDHFSLYKATGDVGQGVAKQGLAAIRGKLKTFIETQVKDHTGDDIKVMNNNVSTAKSLDDAITTRSQRGLTRANITWRDVMVGLGLYAFVNPVVGVGAVFAKKLINSPTFRLRVARALDSWSDARKAKINAALQKGEFPQELENLTTQTDMSDLQKTK